MRAHYGAFYDGPTRDGRALLVVIGNCQAESVRILLDGPAGDVRTVRVPPIHELSAADLVPLARLLEQTDLLVAQPVADDYRGLPLGTSQLAAHLPAHARVALVPSVRWAGLHPHHLLVHPPGLEQPDPPVVPYHDVRTAVAAAWARAGRVAPPVPPLTEAAVHEISRASIAELRRREDQHGTVRISDVLEHPTGVLVRTINHPGNEVLETLTARVRERLGLGAHPSGVDRPLLDSIHAPLDPVVLAAHRLDVEAVPHWRVGDREVGLDEVAAAHLAWYAERPELLDAALERSGALRGVLGLVLPGETPC